MRVKFLKFMAWTTAIVGIASACCLDSDSMAPSIVCDVCIAWWALFAYANNWFEEKPKRRRIRDTATQQQERDNVVVDFNRDREAM